MKKLYTVSRGKTEVRNIVKETPKGWKVEYFGACNGELFVAHYGNHLDSTRQVKIEYGAFKGITTDAHRAECWRQAQLDKMQEYHEQRLEIIRGLRTQR